MKTGTIFVLVAFIVWELEVTCARIPISRAHCEIQCWEDWDCGVGKRCMRRGCSRLCSTFPERGVCVDECQGPWDCALGSWCVNIGCGHVCIPFRNLGEQRPGTCPPLPEGLYGSCDELCTGDESCPPGQKCCSNGCGQVCQTAVRDEDDVIIRSDDN
ncbi:WAP four-disulfide core domain protein 3-like isoform X2 [Physeter macrocephalus]|uniref:WAP four-disulfide core domain protein 3-like isoform X2 n=1 Tax=Physeter macrocephalus TaxID=9755 RepID=A0A2Y9SZZ7_PHYMC|nr:WAP four-disulfide core domain protein 3-like isoform X2 [Physeter catodon]|eukprot:XP_023983713.1 WAP four-disulfide core domain protein 3-like isoform X2 [Physeter catodon]